MNNLAILNKLVSKVMQGEEGYNRDTKYSTSYQKDFIKALDAIRKNEKERIEEISTFILNNWRTVPKCHCSHPVYRNTNTPQICGECKGLIGHSGMCNCLHNQKQTNPEILIKKEKNE